MSRVNIRQVVCRSHLDPDYGPVMAGEKRRRLERRLQMELDAKRSFVMLTLSYERSPYSSPQELYTEASRLQHLNKAMKRLGENVREKLTGRWFAKCEFQTGGWLHYHVILLGFKFLDFDDLYDAWGHGGVYISAGKVKHAGYVSKYCSKESEQPYPEWLYGFKAGSVKLYSASPGFWKPLNELDAEDKPERPISELCQLPDRQHAEYISTRMAAMEADYNGFRTVGQCIDDARQLIRVKDDRGRFQEYQVDEYAVRHALGLNGSEYHGKRLGWHEFSGTVHDVENAVRLARLLIEERETDITFGGGEAGGDGEASFTCHNHKNSTPKQGKNATTMTDLIAARLGIPPDGQLFRGSP